jgi:hypothetical protein
MMSIAIKGLSAALAISALFAVGNAQAAITMVNSQGAFSSLGTITQNTNFDSYGSGWSYPGSPFTVGDLTFVEGGQNLIGGQTGYNFTRNALTDNQVRGTTTNIAGQYDLFGFNAANFYNAGVATFDFITNLGSYQYLQSVPNGAQGFGFFGFAAGAGEYFTSFRFSGAGATGVTDVQLGNVSPVPEPETYAMLLAGFGLMAGIARRRKKQLAA